MSALDLTKHFSGDLSRLTRTIGIAIAFFGLVLVAIIAYAGWSANETATETERTLVENALNHRIARVLNEEKSVAWWDEPITKITDKAIDFDFADTEFGIFLTETYGHDEVHILNGENRPIYSYYGEKRQDPSSFEARRTAVAGVIDEARQSPGPSTLRARPDTFSQSQSNYRVLAGGGQAARWAGHVVTVAGRPALVAAMTIVPNINTSLLKGTPNLLVDIKYIDDTFISEIGRSLLLSDFSLTPKPAQNGAIVSQPFVGDDGVPIGYLNWTTRQPGQVLLTIVLPLVAFGILATGLLSHTILRRLRRASRELWQREAQARHEAKHDALSGLPNRVHMVERIDSFLQGRALASYDNRAVAAYLDIDRFKDINDTLGHQAGDELIKLVAQRLKDCLRSQRLSGAIWRRRICDFVCSSRCRGRIRARGTRCSSLCVAVCPQWPEYSRDRLPGNSGSAGQRGHGRRIDAPCRYRAIRGEGSRPRPRGALLRRNGSPGRASPGNRIGSAGCD